MIGHFRSGASRIESLRMGKMEGEIWYRKSANLSFVRNGKSLIKLNKLWGNEHYALKSMANSLFDNIFLHLISFSLESWSYVF